MARAAVPGRLSAGRRLEWRVSRLADSRDETPTARTLVLDVPDWPGHLAGQHVDVRLTAPDGYSTERSYSLAAPADDGRVQLTVQRVPNGEVSPYLTGVFSPGNPLEIRGPVGGWFVWRPADPGPVLLVAGGSFAQRYRWTHRFTAAIHPVRLQIELAPGLPPDLTLAVYRMEILR